MAEMYKYRYMYNSKLQSLHPKINCNYIISRSMCVGGGGGGGAAKVKSGLN